ncbi:MAG: T9SS type A sorting domain-containing protein [Bacteroidales bacterium]|nr:T9SS type A sorting domain-containing protein [Bacteroidales bacterium]
MKKSILLIGLFIISFNYALGQSESVRCNTSYTINNKTVGFESTEGSMRVGNDIAGPKYRSVMVFIKPSLPANSIVNSVKIILYRSYFQYSPTHITDVCKVTYHSSNELVDYWNEMNTSTIYESDLWLQLPLINPAPITSPGPYSIDLGTEGVADFNEVESHFRVGLKERDDNSIYGIFHGSTSSNPDDYRPELVIEYTVQDIEVSTPSTSTNWYLGSSNNIIWNDNISENVKIELYQGSSNIQTISSSTLSDGLHNWTVSSNLSAGSNYRIKVTSTTNSSLYDYSDYFSLSDVPEINIISPASSNDWTKGRSYDINWNDNISENVKIELYKGSSNIQTINSSTSSDGSYSWTISSSLSAGSDYRIKITSTTNSSLDDYSDYFTISNAPAVNIILPTATDVWETGKSYYIEWTDNFSDNARIEIHKGSTPWQVIEQSVLSNSSGSEMWPWTVPSNFATADNFRIKIVNTSDNTVYDYSDYFSIVDPIPDPFITVASPTSSSNWIIGNTYDIIWTDNISENIKIDLYVGNSLSQTISNSTGSDGSYGWFIPSNLTPGTNYRIKMSSSTNSSLSDYSDYFTISEADYITVISPTSSSNWTVGSSQTITWDDNISDNISIKLYNESSLEETLTTSITSDGTYSWTISSSLTPSSSYQILITSTTNSSLSDYSDYFTLSAPTDYISITSPTSSTDWQTGSSQSITWNDNITENVKIELYNNSNLVSLIISSTTSDGSFSWAVPTTLTAGSGYSIKITSTTNTSIFNYSDNFTISDNSSIFVTSPIGNSLWRYFTQQVITWNSNNIGNVSIELYENDVFKEPISFSTANDGSYEWLINTYSEGKDFRIKVTSLSDPSDFDFSDYFIIYKTNSLTVDYPTSGTDWTGGDSETILWTDNISDFVNIDLTQSGSFVQNLGANIPNTGSFAIIVPTDLPTSDYYEILISSTANGILRNSSIRFTISNPPVLQYVTHLIDDDQLTSNGDDDGIPEPGEVIEMSLVIHNSGPSTASNVSATISTDDSYINITDNQEDFGNIYGFETTQSNSDFDFTISSDCPEKEVTFTLNITSDEGSWTDQFIVHVYEQSNSCDNIISIGGCGSGYTKTYTGGGSGTWFTTTYNPCGYSTPGLEQVYSFVAPSTGTYSIEVTSASGYVDYLWKTSSCSETGWTCINDIYSAGTYGSMSWTAGTTYYILLDDEDATTDTHQFYINCPTTTSPNLEYYSHTIDDDNTTSSGDNDELVEPGESIEMPLTLANTGNATANNVTAILSTTDSDITISDDSESYTAITAAGTAICTADYDFSVSSTCPEKDVTFTLNITSDEGSWTDQFTVHIYAPSQTDPCSNIISIDDCGSSYTKTYTGGGSGVWNITSCGYSTPGLEQIYSFVAPSTGTYSIEVTSASGYVDYFWKTSSCGETGWTCIDDITSAGTYGSMSWTAGTTYYILLDDENATSGTHQFYIYSGCNDPLEPNDSYNLAYAIGADTSYDNNEVCLTTEDEDWFKFTYNFGEYYFKVTGYDSAEEGAYGINFIRNDNVVTIETYETNGSTDTRLYLYDTDHNTIIDSNDDSGSSTFSYLNFIFEPTSIAKLDNKLSIELFPNPVEDKCYIEITGLSGNSLIVELLNINGQKIYSKNFDDKFDDFKIEIDLSGYSQGIYFVKIHYDNITKTGKFILQ